MTPAATPILRDIVLIGGGHSHVGVLHMFGMRPEPGVRLTVICTDTDTPYSGMLPGYVAGHYGFDDVHIDLRRLAQFAGARYIRDEVTAIDRAARLVHCAGRPPVRYDVLSINIGSTPQLDGVPGAAEHAVPVKPIRAFNERWLALLGRVRASTTPLTIAIVGAGAGGVELCLAMQHRLRRERAERGGDPGTLRFHVYSADAQILRTHNAAVRRAFARTLAERGVEVHVGATVNRVEADALYTADGTRHAADEIVWVTQAGGAAWLARTGLARDAQGFVIVTDTLRTVTDTAIFAAGDCAAFQPRALEKAGVFAVRMGRPLADNLRRTVRGESLRAYRPQRHWLSLISTGDRHAVASRGPLYLRGDWVWRWKDHIDRTFMRKFTELPMMDATRAPAPAPTLPLDAGEAQQAISALAMRCGGCGAKVGASVLSRALANIEPLARDDVLIGLKAPDDAAVVRVPPGMAMVHTVDFFRAFIDDPYVFGRIAANHALGDLFAMGAAPQSATAIATVPPGLEGQVEDTLYQMMSGAVSVLNDAGCALVGGHTGEGAELALGFALNGLIDERLAGVMTKGALRPGDVLILTKPIGTGTLFAAHARGRAKGRWIDAALVSMQVSNQAAAACLRAHGASACTDLTGFGLLGHLVEMTRPSGVDAEIDLAALPVLEGAEDMLAAGISSSLAPANVRLRRALRDAQAAIAHPRYGLLFDPQTAGGLLAGVAGGQAETCIAALRAAGYAQAAVIGRVLPQGDDAAPIVLRM